MNARTFTAIALLVCVLSMVLRPPLAHSGVASRGCACCAGNAAETCCAGPVAPPERDLPAQGPRHSDEVKLAAAPSLVAVIPTRLFAEEVRWVAVPMAVGCAGVAVIDRVCVRLI